MTNLFDREHAKINRSNTNIFGTPRYNLYDGNMGNKDRFGIKYMPLKEKKYIDKAVSD